MSTGNICLKECISIDSPVLNGETQRPITINVQFKISVNQILNFLLKLLLVYHNKCKFWDFPYIRGRKNRIPYR